MSRFKFLICFGIISLRAIASDHCIPYLRPTQSLVQQVLFTSDLKLLTEPSAVQVSISDDTPGQELIATVHSNGQVSVLKPDGTVQVLAKINVSDPRNFSFLSPFFLTIQGKRYLLFASGGQGRLGNLHVVDLQTGRLGNILLNLFVYESIEGILSKAGIGSPVKTTLEIDNGKRFLVAVTEMNYLIAIPIDQLPIEAALKDSSSLPNLLSAHLAFSPVKLARYQQSHPIDFVTLRRHGQISGLLASAKGDDGVTKLTLIDWHTGKHENIVDPSQLPSLSGITTMKSVERHGTTESIFIGAFGGYLARLSPVKFTQPLVNVSTGPAVKEIHVAKMKNGSHYLISLAYDGAIHILNIESNSTVTTVQFQPEMRDYFSESRIVIIPQLRMNPRILLIHESTFSGTKDHFRIYEILPNQGVIVQVQNPLEIFPPLPGERITDFVSSVDAKGNVFIVIGTEFGRVLGFTQKDRAEMLD